MEWDIFLLNLKEIIRKLCGDSGEMIIHYYFGNWDKFNFTTDVQKQGV